ncbi:hypothetical protein ABL78_0515 [Leptomonas seymouri]|uniref:Uncharacterized protein n=1 Tax=Leptomonas seymouri TaxID=5684 RepID=A0A0N0P8S7_LEPSE|nr:hypothetical protein ABL78_0515 [Leptomonas seymouri]|eukprot:KPI90289.1 hypothetical protein ABL78_0515 [Leptomonas seymouri]
MSYVIEYAENLHSSFRAPNSFCHDLLHVIRGALKNLTQVHLPRGHLKQLKDYELILAGLQNIVNTNKMMSECTMAQCDTFTMMESTADFLAASATSDALPEKQQRRTRLSTYSLKPFKVPQEQPIKSVDAVGAEKLRALLTNTMVEQLEVVYSTARTIQGKEMELKALEAKVRKYAKRKKTEKLQEAEQAREAVEVEVVQHKDALQNALAKYFPEVYTHVLQEYIDLCNMLLSATKAGTEIPKCKAPGATAQANKDAAHRRQASLALTVETLKVHEALTTVKQEGGKVSERYPQGKMGPLVALVSPAGKDAAKVRAPSSVRLSGTERGASRQGGASHSAAPSQTLPTKCSTVSMSGRPSRISVPKALSTADSTAREVCKPLSAAQSSPSHMEEDSTADHAMESVVPSLTGTPHSRFPFWFRYYYFDRLESSTERLAIDFGLYISHCKRLARKAGYTIPLAIKKHMNRVEREFTTARYARHKLKFQAVLKDIFNYRKNLEVMDTYVRLAEEAEAHMSKHAGSKNKKSYEKWKTRWNEANDSVQQLREEVFGRGVQEMVQFYDQLLQCIRGFMSDLIVTLGGNPD